MIHVQTGGWAYKSEDRQYLITTRTQVPYCMFPGTNMPDEIIRRWNPIEMQGMVGACQGFSASTGGEIVFAEFGGSEQFSPLGAYIMSQRFDNIQGDRGSTIAAGCRVATELGFVLESVWPFHGRYDPRIPDGYDTAVKYKMGGHSELTSYDDLLKHIGIVRGSGHAGVIWSSGVDRAANNNKGLVADWPSGSGGGHAIEAIGYAIADFEGNALPGDDPWILWANSWDVRWGWKGMFMTSPRATDQMISARWSVFQGLFGWESPEPQPPNYGEI